MTMKGGITVKQAVLPPTPPCMKPYRTLRKAGGCCAVNSLYKRRARGDLATCHSAPQQWRSQPVQHPSSAQRSGSEKPPALAWAAGAAVLAMVAFNLVRSVVLSWVRSQPRNPQQRQQQRQQQQQPLKQASLRTVAPPAVASGTTGTDSTLGHGVVVDVEATGPAGAGDAATAVVRTPAPSSPRLQQQQQQEGAFQGEGLEDSAASAAVGGSLQIASYQLRPRGSKPSNNLGRVVLCAALQPEPEPEAEGGAAGPGPGSGAKATSQAGGPRRSVEWHQRFWEPLISKYSDGPDDRVSGLLVVYDNSVLHILEGDNNQLFALMRELRPQDAAIHRLFEIRVPCYILDLRERLFESWLCAEVRRPADRRRTLLGGSAKQAAALRALEDRVAAYDGMPPGMEDRVAAYDGMPPGMDVDVEGNPDKEPEAPRREQQLVSRIEQLELFVKFAGPKLSALASPGALIQALRHLPDFESTTPPESVVSSLAGDSMAPSLHDFVDAFDADYRRYMALLALMAEEADQARGDGGRRAPLSRVEALAGEIRHLHRFYGEHLERDLQDAMDQREEERKGSSADEVVRRLSRGMRLRVMPSQPEREL